MQSATVVTLAERVARAFVVFVRWVPAVSVERKVLSPRSAPTDLGALFALAGATIVPPSLVNEADVWDAIERRWEGVGDGAALPSELDGVSRRAADVVCVLTLRTFDGELSFGWREHHKYDWLSSKPEGYNAHGV